MFLHPQLIGRDEIRAHRRDAQTYSSPNMTRCGLSEYIPPRLSISSSTTSGVFRKTSPWPTTWRYVMGPGRKRQHGCATLGAEHTVLLRPLFGGEPELLWGEIGNVSENGDGLRARGERRRWLRCGEATIEGVGDGHGGEIGRAHV